MHRSFWLLACALWLGCGTGSGALAVQLAAERTIADGLAAGTAAEDIVDGWSVTFDRYVVVIDDIEIAGGGAEHFHQHDAIAVELKAVPESGIELARFDGMAEGLWPDVRYSFGVADASTRRHASVPEDVLARMVAGGCTYLVQGAISHPSGQRCIRGDSTMCDAATEIRFDLCVPAATAVGPCESDTGIEGVVVAASTSTAVHFTIHGDHLFFNGFPAGAEGSVARRAQWMANADVDADGTVERSDLESIRASDLGQLLPSDPGDGMPGFSLGSAPLVDGHGLESAWDYVRAQLMTQGHFQGEGDCPIGAP